MRPPLNPAAATSGASGAWPAIRISPSGDRTPRIRSCHPVSTGPILHRSAGFRALISDLSRKQRLSVGAASLERTRSRQISHLTGKNQGSFQMNRVFSRDNLAIAGNRVCGSGNVSTALPQVQIPGLQPPRIDSASRIDLTTARLSDLRGAYPIIFFFAALRVPKLV